MHFFHFRDLLRVERGREVRGDGLLSRCSHNLFLGPTFQNWMSSFKCDSIFCVQIRGGFLGSW